MSDNTISYQEYWTEVRAVASALIEEACDKNALGPYASNDAVREHAQEHVFETVDGHEWVIYTWANPYVLIHSESEEALFEDFGEVSTESYTDIMGKMAFAALRADVERELERALDEREEPEDPDAAIEELARDCAKAALAEGATAPWPGDGDMQPGDLEALDKLVGGKATADQIATFEVQFRISIRAYSKRVKPG